MVHTCHSWQPLSINYQWHWICIAICKEKELDSKFQVKCVDCDVTPRRISQWKLGYGGEGKLSLLVGQTNYYDIKSISIIL